MKALLIDESRGGINRQRDGQLLRCVPKTLIPVVIASRFSLVICWLYLPPPNSFTEFVDKVELALLQQVHSKSIAFFHLTNQFGQLMEWIAGLVEEVQRVWKLLSPEPMTTTTTQTCDKINDWFPLVSMCETI